MADSAGVTHDITLALPGGEPVGLMVDWERGPLHGKPYTRTAPKLVSGDIEHENYTIDSYFSQDDFSGGLSQYRLKNRTRYWDALADTREPEVAKPAPLFTQQSHDRAIPAELWCGRFVDTFANTLWLISSSSVEYLSAGVWTVDATYPALHTMASTDAVLYKNVLYIARGAAGAIASRTAAGVWANLTFDGYKLAVYEDALWRSDANSKLYYAKTPTGAWETFPGDVGTQEGIVRRMAVFKGKLYIIKDDGLYYIDGRTGDGIAHLLTPFMGRLPRPMTGWLLYAWHGWLYYSVGNALWRYDGENIVERVSWNFGAGGDVYGDYSFLTAAGDDSWLYVQVSNNMPVALQTVIMAYDGVSSGGAGWHKLHVSTGEPDGLIITTNLWAAVSNGDTTAYTFALQNPQHPISFATGGYLDSSVDNLQRADVDKWFASVELSADNLSATNKITVTVYVDGTAYVIGDFTQSPQQSRDFPVNTTGRLFYVHVAFTVSDAANPPALRDIVVRCVPNVEVKQSYTCRVKLADNLQTLSGFEQIPIAVKRTHLAACAASVAPVTLGLPDGTTTLVKLIESPDVEWQQSVRDSNVRDLSLNVGLQLLEV